VPTATDPTAAALFAAANAVALPAWLLLAGTLFVPRLRAWGWRVTGLALPALFAAAYLVALGAALRGGAGGGFGSIGEVRTLFADDRALTAGWVHYLAFDLFVGTWVAREGVRGGLPGLLVLPCLVLTFLAGPAGLLAFLALRAVVRTRPVTTLGAESVA
jgi:hypothetical protein